MIQGDFRSLRSVEHIQPLPLAEWQGNVRPTATTINDAAALFIVATAVRTLACHSTGGGSRMRPFKSTSARTQKLKLRPLRSSTSLASD